MERYVLYVASKHQVQRVKESLKRLEAVPKIDYSTVAELYEIQHRFLNGISLNLHLLTDISGACSHLRQNPVDLLIYDERGEGGREALESLAMLREDVRFLSETWGPDFQFPMGRIVAILKNDKEASHRSFLLGQEHVRSVFVDPESLASLLRSLTKLLTSKRMVHRGKVGVALSGGGLEGFLFQLGCLHGLNTAITGRSLENCEVYSGVSSGSIAASALAAKVSCLEMIKSMHQKSEVLKSFKGSVMFDLAGKDILSRVVKQSFAWAGMDRSKWLQKVTRSVPTGFFKGEGLKKFVHDTLQSVGIKDDFNQLECELYIGATDQDTFEHVVMGEVPWNHVPISEAVRASCALPPFFTPYRIGGRNFIDGQVTRTCNLELVIQKGCRLLFIIDPIRPYSTLETGSVDREGGIYALIQAIKALVSTRFKTSLSNLTERYPDVDFLVFQPYEECAQLMAGSPMRYMVRTKLIDLAFKGTLMRLRERHHVYSTMLSRYGFKLKSQRELLRLEGEGIKV